MRTTLRATVAAVLFTAIPTPVFATSDEPVPPTAQIGEWGVDTASISDTVRPGDDFYRYVNEGWLKTAKAPDGIPYIDAFVEVYLSTEQRVGGIIAEARESTDAPGSPEQLIGDFHRSTADVERRNALGITPIASTLSIILGTWL